MNEPKQYSDGVWARPIDKETDFPKLRSDEWFDGVSWQRVGHPGQEGEADSTFMDDYEYRRPVPAPERRKEQGHEPWPGTPGAQELPWPQRAKEELETPSVEEIAREAADKIVANPNVSCAGTTPLRVALQFEPIIVAAITRALAARGVQPAAQTPCPCEVNNMLAPCAAQGGAPAAEQDCTNHYSDGSKIFPNRDCCVPAPTQEKPETASASRIDVPTVEGLWEYLNYQFPGTQENIPLREFCAQLRQEWPLALTQASVTELQRQLAQERENAKVAVEGVIEVFSELNKSLEAKLESAQAACKAKDEALTKIQWMAELGFWEEGGCSECGQHDDEGHTSDCMIGKALAIQPSSGLPESSPSSPASR